MKKLLIIIASLSSLALVSCNIGSSHGPSNAFTQANSNGNFLTFNYTAAAASTATCQDVIAAGNSIYLNNGTYGYNYNVNNSSAQLCDDNNNNCLNSNNTNTPCISGTQTLNGVSEQVVWTNCSYSQNTFTAQLTISSSPQSCTGTVSGQSIALPNINVTTDHNNIHVLMHTNKQ